MPFQRHGALGMEVLADLVSSIADSSNGLADEALLTIAGAVIPLADMCFGKVERNALSLRKGVPLVRCAVGVLVPQCPPLLRDDGAQCAHS